MARPKHHTPLSETLQDMGIIMYAGYFVILLFIGVTNLLIPGQASENSMAGRDFCLWGILFGGIAHIIGNILEWYRMACATSTLSGDLQ